MSIDFKRATYKAMPFGPADRLVWAWIADPSRSIPASLPFDAPTFLRQERAVHAWTFDQADGKDPGRIMRAIRMRSLAVKIADRSLSPQALAQTVYGELHRALIEQGAVTPRGELSSTNTRREGPPPRRMGRAYTPPPAPRNLFDEVDGKRGP